MIFLGIAHLSSLLLLVQGIAAPDPRFRPRAEILAEISSAKIGCRSMDMILNERAFNLFQAQAKEYAFYQGTSEGEAVSIIYAASQAHIKAVEEAGGDRIKAGTDPVAIAKYHAYWASRCRAIKSDPIKSQFFTTRAVDEATRQPPPPAAVSAMCYKDYCPCSGKQAALDKYLCDHLQEGMDVDIQSMITGRALRALQSDMDSMPRP